MAIGRAKVKACKNSIFTVAYLEHKKHIGSPLNLRYDVVHYAKLICLSSAGESNEMNSDL